MSQGHRAHTSPWPTGPGFSAMSWALSSPCCSTRPGIHSLQCPAWLRTHFHPRCKITTAPRRKGEVPGSSCKSPVCVEPKLSCDPGQVSPCWSTWWHSANYASLQASQGLGACSTRRDQRLPAVTKQPLHHPCPALLLPPRVPVGAQKLPAPKCICQDTEEENERQPGHKLGDGSGVGDSFDSRRSRPLHLAGSSSS